MIEKNNDLLSGLKSGDKKIFKEIFNTYYEPLVRFCMQRIKNQQDAEEIAQDIFVNLWSKREEISITSSLSGYIFRSARNRIINLSQHEKVKINHREQVIARSNESGYETDHFTKKEIGLLVKETVNSMPEKRKKVYLLSRNQGLKYTQIGEQMNISVKTVEAHISAALNQLRTTLKDYLQLFLLLIKVYFFL